jgi:hypothetical protein
MPTATLFEFLVEIASKKSHQDQMEAVPTNCENRLCERNVEKTSRKSALLVTFILFSLVNNAVSLSTTSILRVETFKQKMMHSFGPIGAIVRNFEENLPSSLHMVASGLFGDYDGSSTSSRSDNQRSALYPPTTVRTRRCGYLTGQTFESSISFFFTQACRFLIAGMDHLCRSVQGLLGSWR